ncbi:hypothetical protein M4D13_26185, partial [Klebsiella pneumoniae]|nr:hypothetical protein [Klebsiella pneumoniae]
RKSELRKYRSLFIAQGGFTATSEEGSRSIKALRANVEKERKQQNQSLRKKANSSEGHPLREVRLREKRLYLFNDDRTSIF